MAGVSQPFFYKLIMTKQEKILFDSIQSELKQLNDQSKIIYSELVGDPVLMREGLLSRQKKDEEFQTVVKNELKSINDKAIKLVEKSDQHDRRIMQLESKLSILDAFGKVRKSMVFVLLLIASSLTAIVSFWDTIKNIFQE